MSHCIKVDHRNQRRAKRVAKWLVSTQGWCELSAYKCKGCGGWHLGNNTHTKKYGNAKHFRNNRGYA